MTEVKTDPNLLKKLRDAAKRELSATEIEKQRVSFVYSGLPEDSGMSKVDIEKVLKKA